MINPGNTSNLNNLTKLLMIPYYRDTNMEYNLYISGLNDYKILPYKLG
jgi:hypothetical protein